MRTNMSAQGQPFEDFLAWVRSTNREFGSFKSVTSPTSRVESDGDISSLDWGISDVVSEAIRGGVSSCLDSDAQLVTFMHSSISVVDVGQRASLLRRGPSHFGLGCNTPLELSFWKYTPWGHLDTPYRVFLFLGGIPFRNPCNLGSSSNWVDFLTGIVNLLLD
uniref:Uncharacterized protein n=1 Tax=Cannabis sativa TaxID=3483 RepID=A0A803QAG8_CANSA